MILKKILYILYLIPIFIYSQNDFTNIYYFLEDGKEVTQNDFDKLKKTGNYISKSHIKNSDLFKILFKKKLSGTLSESDYRNLKNNFPSIFFNKKKYTIIEFITSGPSSRLRESKLNGYVYQFDFINEINKQQDVSIHFVSDQKNFPKVLKFSTKKRKIIKDENDLIKNIFYPSEFLYHNFTIIRDDGVYVSEYGEHSPIQVFNALKELREK